MKKFLLFVLGGIIVLFFSFFLSSSAQAATLEVPRSYPTIQEAINAASSGDIIEVGPGTYQEFIDTGGKSITIQSTDGAEATIIDPTGIEDGYNDFNYEEEFDLSSSGSTYSKPAFSDIDEDGDIDLIVGYSNGQIIFFEHDGAGNYTGDLDYFSIDVGSYADPAFADIDMDGDEDMFIGESDGNINYYEKQADNSFVLNTETWQSIDVGSRSTLAFQDLDGDGDLDLIVGESNGNLNLYENDASSFSLVTENFGSIDVGNYSDSAFIDQNNDGLEDLIIGESGSNLNFYENMGDTDADGFYNFELRSELFQRVYTPYASPGVEDVNLDGVDDMFIGNSDGNLVYYSGQGDIRSSGTVVSLNSSILDGFTVQNGYLESSSSAPGVECIGDCKVLNSIIQDNQGVLTGAIFVGEDDSLVLEGSTVRRNSAFARGGSASPACGKPECTGTSCSIPTCVELYYTGSAVHCEGDCTIERNVISENDPRGMVIVKNASAIVRWNTIENNRSTKSDTQTYYGSCGSGIYISRYTNNLIKNNIIRDNGDTTEEIFRGQGAGIYSSSGLVENNVFFGNLAHSYGAGFYGTATARNNIFTDNHSNWWGGAAYPSGSFYNNTAVSNYGGHGGGAIFVQSSLPSLFFNNIFSNNTGNYGVYSYDGDSRDSDDYNNYYSNSVGNAYNLTLGLNDIFENPLFAAFSDDGDWTNDDLSLQASSPNIDAGNPAYFDPDGSQADIGAYGGVAADEWDLDGDGYIGGPWGSDLNDLDDSVPGTTSSLVLDYSFDSDWVFDDATVVEESGRTIDKSAFSNHGTYSGASEVNGPFNEAFEFDGASYVEVPDSESLDLEQNISLEAWIYPTDLHASGRQWIVRKSGGNAYGMFLENGWIHFYTYTTSWMSAAWVVPENEWSYVSGTYDSATGTMNFYINGSLVTTRSQSGNLNTTTGNLYIGAGNSTPSQTFYGIIDELKIYSEALSQDEIKEDMMDNGKGFKVLEYNFNDGTATDQTPLGNDGTLSNTSSDTGIDGNALSFDGSTSYLAVPDAASLDLQDALTIEAWVYPTNLNGTRRIIQRGSGTWGLFIRNNWLFFYTDTRHDGGAWLSSAWTIPRDRWSHVAGVYDGSRMYLYTNGQLRASRSQSGQLNTTTSNLFIGAANSTPSEVFQGRIDEVKIYNRALSQGQIEYDMQVSMPDEVLYFNFDDGTAQDQSNLENNGTIVGAAAATVDGRNSLLFDGSDYVSVPDSDSLDPIDEVTVEAFVYPTNLSAEGTQRIVQRGSNTWGLYLSGGWLFFYTDTRHDGGAWLSSAWTIPTNTWSHVAGVYNRREQTMQLYVNGSLVASRSQTGKLNTTGSSLYLGSNNATPAQTFYGYIDDVRIYNKALSQSEIARDAGL